MSIALDNVFNNHSGIGAQFHEDGSISLKDKLNYAARNLMPESPVSKADMGQHAAPVKENPFSFGQN
jgi:hypothetical protein